MTYLNKIAFLLLGIMFSININAQNFEEITIDLSEPDKIGFLDVGLKSGTVKVTGTARQDVLIKYASLEGYRKRKKSKSSNGLKKIVATSMDLEISEDDNHLKIDSDDWNKGLVLEIEIPQEMNLKLDTYNNGDINVDNVTGALELTSYNGSIKATNISGSVIADTYNGKITVTFNKVTPNEPMAFTNYNDGLDLTFPDDIAATFKINNKMGDVYTGFDMKMVKQKPQIKKGNKKKFVIGKWVVGKVNGGGPEITLENYNGDVYIRKAGQE